MDRDKLIAHAVYECLNEKNCIAVVFDDRLNYLAANHLACMQLTKSEHELVGRNIIELFPQIIASENHRNLLMALAGETVSADLHINGQFYETTYLPILISGKCVAISVRSKKISE